MATENQKLDAENSMFDKAGNAFPKVVGMLMLTLASYHTINGVFGEKKNNQIEQMSVSDKSSIDGSLMDGLISKIGVDGSGVSVNDKFGGAQLKKVDNNTFDLILTSGEGDEVVYNFVTLTKDEVSGAYNITNYNIQYKDRDDSIIPDGETYESVTEALSRLNK